MASFLPEIVILLEENHFEFVYLPDRLKCIICCGILKNAKQTPCGCRVCERCIQDYLFGYPKPCPNNQVDCEVRLTIGEIYPDNAVNREIKNLIAKCPLKSCKYSAALKYMAEHIKTCEWREVNCGRCSEKFVFKETTNHAEKRCEMRLVNCEYCNVQMVYKDLMVVHLNDISDELCIQCVCLCPNNCLVKEKVHLKVHLKICENKKLKCPFHGFKCEAGKMTKEKLVDHLRNEQLVEIEALVSKILIHKRKGEALKDELRDVEQQNMKLVIMISDKFGVIRNQPRTDGMINTSMEQMNFRNECSIWNQMDFELSIEKQVSSREFRYKLCLKNDLIADEMVSNIFLTVSSTNIHEEFYELFSYPFEEEVTIRILGQYFNPNLRSGEVQQLTDCRDKRLKCPFNHRNCEPEKMTKENLLNHLQNEHNAHKAAIDNKIKILKEKDKNLMVKLDDGKKRTENLRDMITKLN